MRTDRLQIFGAAAERAARAADFIEVAKMIGASGSAIGALNRAEAQKAAPHIIAGIRAAVPGLTTDSGAALMWGALQSAFIGALHGVFDTLLPSMYGFAGGDRVALSTSAYLGEEVLGGDSVPLGKLQVGDGTVLPIRAIMAFLVVSKELLRSGGAVAAALVDRGLRDAVQGATDRVFLRLLSATNEPIPSTGDSQSDIAALSLAVAPVANAKLYFVAEPLTVRSLANLRGPTGRLWPEVTLTGGSLLGVPLLPSDQLEPGSMMLIDASRLAGDGGSISIAASSVADVMMTDDAPGTMSIAAGSPPQPVSMFMTGSTALRANRYFSLLALQVTSVATLSGVDYSGGSAQ
jgi:hypothetical protein